MDRKLEHVIQDTLQKRGPMSSTELYATLSLNNPSGHTLKAIEKTLSKNDTMFSEVEGRWSCLKYTPLPSSLPLPSFTILLPDGAPFPRY